MKKFLVAVAFLSLLTACGGDEIDGKSYDSYGLVNKEAKENPDVVYEISAASVILSIIFIETIVVPVYIVGWDLYKPVKIKKK